MQRMVVIFFLFVGAGLCEIGVGYLVWGWMRKHKPLVWAVLGAVVLATCGVVTLQAILPLGPNPHDQHLAT